MSSALTHSQPTVLRPQSLNELVNFANIAAKSSMLPPAYTGKPENIVMAVQLGSELGLAPMQALQNIAVIGGRPTVWGDAMLGLVRQSPLCEDIEEHFEGEGDKLTAVCVAKRVGKKPVTQAFSVEDAKKASLWGKTGPWAQYPKRMLQMRARGFALRDAFPDVLRGLISAEEANDIPAPEPFTGTTIEAKPEPAPLRAAAAAMPPPPKVVDPTVYEAPKPPKATPPRSDDQWNVWLGKLADACSVLYHRQELVEVGERATVRDALKDGPEWVQREISDILAANFKRLPEHAPADDLPEIVGEHLAAG